MKTSDPAHVAKELAWHMEQLGIDTSNGPALTDIIKAQANVPKHCVKWPNVADIFMKTLSLAMRCKRISHQRLSQPLTMVRDRFASLSDVGPKKRFMKSLARRG